MLLSVIIHATDLPQLISICQVGQGLHTHADLHYVNRQAPTEAIVANV